MHGAAAHHGHHGHGTQQESFQQWAFSKLFPFNARWNSGEHDEQIVGTVCVSSRETDPFTSNFLVLATFYISS